MASKLLLKHLQTLTNTTRHRMSSSGSNISLSLNAFVRRRLFSDAAPAAPSAASIPPAVALAPTPPPSEIDPEKPGNAKKVVKKSGSINEAELAKFAATADKWWEAEGPHKALHAMNPTRLAFLRSTLCRHFGKDPSSARPFEGLKFVDVGCGGGILTEPLARLGANVTGIDALEKNINIARHHSALDPTTSSIEYLCTTAENLVEEQRKFDAVISLEVIEHVDDPAEFCKYLSALTVPGGATVISTINRSMRSYAAAIVGAEYLLRWVPVGTHDWLKFVTPEELILILQRSSISVQELAGLVINPLTGQWLLSEDVGVNYIAFGTKNSESSHEDPAFK